MTPERFVFAHLADAHIGAWARDVAIRQALRESVLRALDVARERRVEFLLVSGDLFHNPVPDPTEVAPLAGALRRLVDDGIRVYLIFGSHDYVAHRTGWLDVLGEAGVFVRVAPEAVRATGQHWTLPFQIDRETGARIAGISGRAHGLDREYFHAVDSTAFRAEPGFKVFQFHAAVEEYLPEGLRGHVPSVPVADLPAGCDYYAGGHIHTTYTGQGPGGGLLVNPGAVFGTSRPDLEAGLEGRTAQGLAIVSVTGGVPSVEFVTTAPRETLRLVDVDVTGRDLEEARREVRRRLEDAEGPGSLVFPRVHGALREGDATTLDLAEIARGVPAARGSIHWDLRDLVPTTHAAESRAPSEVELEELTRLCGAGPDGPRWLAQPGATDRLRELLRDLGTPIADGEARADYLDARRRGALALIDPTSEA